MCDCFYGVWKDQTEEYEAKIRFYLSEEKYRSRCGVGHKFGTIQEIQEYVLELYPGVLISKSSRSNVSACSGLKIEMAETMMDEETVLHELSHVDLLSEGHGPKFVGAFLNLMETQMGIDKRVVFEDIYAKESA